MTSSSKERADQITSIIAQRQPIANKIAEVIVYIRELDNALKALETNQRKQLEQSSNQPEILKKLEGIDLLSIRPKIRDELEILDKLKARFSRKTLILW